MSAVRVHQAIHGYRDGHRLLSSSLSLSADAARSMLVLSDMSGPAMHPGFDEYVTGYPLPGSEFFVLAKTWYAPEMQRPGCVWTHSLLLSREQISQTSTSSLVSKFRRPQQSDIESAANFRIEIGESLGGDEVGSLGELGAASSLVEAVLGQRRPVIVIVEKVAQLERTFLRLWEALWPAARARFSFCTGALLPRSVAGALLDLQAVPRAIPSSQFRKSAGTALVLDLLDLGAPAPWVELFIQDVERGDSKFGSWVSAAAGTEPSRGILPGLAPIYGAWHEPGSSARSALKSVLLAKELEPSARCRLIGMAFERADAEAGAVARRELLQDLSGYQDSDLAPIGTILEFLTRELFSDSRAEGIALVRFLLRSALGGFGERILSAAVLLLTSSDLEAFGDAQQSYLPAIVGANPKLASSPVFWSRLGFRSREMLYQLSEMNLTDEVRVGIVNAIFESRSDVSVEALIRFGGLIAVLRGLSEISSGEIQLSWPWRVALGERRDTVLDWLEGLQTPSQNDLDLCSRLMSPKFAQARLTTVWNACTCGGGEFSSRVAAFGLALAFGEGNVNSPLFAKYFQPAYEAAGNSELEYEEWDWMREYAPSSSYWRDWDRCGRLAKAMARLFERQGASLEVIFRIVRTRLAILKIAAALGGDQATRPYLTSLFLAVASSQAGTREQRAALAESWGL